MKGKIRPWVQLEPDSFFEPKRIRGSTEAIPGVDPKVSKFVGKTQTEVLQEKPGNWRKFTTPEFPLTKEGVAKFKPSLHHVLTHGSQYSKRSIGFSSKTPSGLSEPKYDRPEIGTLGMKTSVPKTPISSKRFPKVPLVDDLQSIGSKPKVPLVDDLQPKLKTPEWTKGWKDLIDINKSISKLFKNAYERIRV